MTNVACSKQLQIDQALKRMLKGTVPVMSIDALAALLDASVDWIVLDSRESVEFKVSHLANAKWVGYKDFSKDRVANIAKNHNVLVYCSIGVRSEQIAEKLLAMGFTAVWNLYGGIFSWANNGNALVDHNQQATQKVHGFDKNWSKLVVNPFMTGNN